MPTRRRAYLGLTSFRSRFLDVFDLAALLGWSAPAPEAAYLLSLPAGEYALAASLPEGSASTADSAPVVATDWPAALSRRTPEGAYVLDLTALSLDP